MSVFMTVPFQSFIHKQKHTSIRRIYSGSVYSDFYFEILSAQPNGCNIELFYEGANSCKPDYIMLSSRSHIKCTYQDGCWNKTSETEL